MHYKLALATFLSDKDPPLIDLDSTVLLQALVFAITAFLLTKLLFKPYLKVRDARELGIEGARAEAARMVEEADAKIAEYDLEMNKARQTANKERQVVRDEVKQRALEISAEATKKVQATLVAARETLDAEATSARKDLEPRVTEIAAAIVSKVLGREAS